MKIMRVEIKDGYKRFHHLTIDLGIAPARIVALVGPNGCGKSSVLDALLYMHTSQQQMIGQSGRGNDYHSMHGVDFSAAKSISVQFGDGTYKEVIKKKAELPEQKRNTLFSFRSCYRYNSRVKIQESRAMDAIGLNNYGATVTADLDEKMEGNYRRLLALFNQHMKEKDVKYSEAAATIIGDLNSSLKSCLDIEIESLGNIEAGEGALYFKKADHAKPFEFNVLSAGEKEAVDILLDLYLRKDNYDDTIFLIDEPELHINTAIQRKLLIEVNRLIGPNCQLWVATHSIGFLRALQNDLKDQCQVLQFKPEFPYAAKPITLTPVKPSLPVWHEIFSTALDDLVGLVAPKRVIYCEGRDKPGRQGAELGIDARVFNIIFGEAYPDTLFVSSGGNTELEQRRSITLAIISKALKDLEILVLRDRDIDSAKPATEGDRQALLAKEGAYLRVLKRFEIENYLFDPGILAAYCKARGVELDERKLKAAIKDIINDNVKDQVSAVKGACGVAANYGNDKFKLELTALIRPGTDVYAELVACIFSRK